MRSRCGVYVDAGYLLASAATRVTGTSLRSGVHVLHERLITALTEQAERSSGLPLLRINWYDSGARTGGIADPVQEQIGMLPRVKLRLGRLSHAGEQKGVDVRIGLDLIMHARNRAVDVMFLVSGDDDLTEAVEEVQGHGIQVVLLSVPNLRGRPHAVSRHLQREADGVEMIDAEAIDTSVIARKTAEPEPEPAPAPVPPVRDPARPSPTLLAGRRPAPRPAEPPRAHLVYSSATGSATGSAGGGEHPPEADEALVDEVCVSVLTTWARGADPVQVERLSRGRPMIPPEIDRALLVDIAARVDSYYLEDETRRALRERFWVQLDRLPTGGEGGARPDSERPKVNDR